jgi:hypothetical protein
MRVEEMHEERRRRMARDALAEWHAVTAALRVLARSFGTVNMRAEQRLRRLSFNAWQVV